MMKFLVLFGLFGLSLAKVDYSGHRVYRAFPNILQNKVISDIGKELDLDFWSDYRFDGDFVDFRVPPQLQTKIDIILSHNRIRYEIFIEDLEISLNAQISPREDQFDLATFEYNVYHTFEEIDSWITDFTNANSQATALNVGTGSSYEGRNMRAIKISTGKFRPAFVIDCGIHAREWVSPSTCMYTANKLVSDYGKVQSVTDLMNAVDFYLIPVSNPDGYDYTWTNDRMWRKTRSPRKGVNCVCDGVDPNRNWDYHWGDANSDTKCCSEAYRGPSPFSEIETQNQRDFVKGISNVKAYMDIHAYGQYWMYPYGWTTVNCPYEAMLKQIGTASVAAIAAVNGKRYETGAIADIFSIATGSTVDYFFNQNIICSFAAELRDTGEDGFVLPENQIIPTGEETFAGLMKIANAVASGLC